MRLALSAVLVFILSCLAQAGAVEVVSTRPVHGATNVDPALAEIRVTFTEPMRQDSYSFVVNNDRRFPEIAGDPYFVDEFTCVLPVRLEANTEYSMFINGGRHWNFVSVQDNEPAASVELTFTTGPAR